MFLRKVIETHLVSHQQPVQWEVNLIALVNTEKHQHTVWKITNIKTETTTTKDEKRKSGKGGKGEVNH